MTEDSGVTQAGEKLPASTVRVAVETPHHASIASILDYESESALSPGTLVRVPLGKRVVTGIVWNAVVKPTSDTAARLIQLRPINDALRAIAPLPASWRALVGFAAGYYQRSVGEMALSALPPELRKLDNTALAKRIARLRKLAVANEAAVPAAGGLAAPALPEATAEQQAVLQALATAFAAPAADPEADLLARPHAANALFAPRPVLLHGVTGSGKTEIYLRLAAQALSAGRQPMLLVPEINLTPQLESRVRERFPGRLLVSLHSGLTSAQRLNNWLLAALGLADMVLGTRLAVFAPLPRLGLVIVDEEHDASYKQQEGARYSARDLAVYLAHLERVPVLLGSATPSLESWQRSLDGRYLRLSMAHRVGAPIGEPSSGGAAVGLPLVRTIDMGREAAKLPAAQRKGQPPMSLAPALVDAIAQRVALGEQSLLLLNRRGYAPVLHCPDCGWKSGCPHCSAWRVFHKGDRTLRCHHCGFAESVPRACPECGNLDIQPIGRGTEKLEEQVTALLPGARIARIDADSTRHAGALQAQLAAVHAGEVDVLVGTQMVTKGHDFRRVTLVAAVNPDGALFASDFRAGERLFALLMQAAGRAGRDASAAGRSQMWLQTWFPQHPLYEALRRHDFAAFAASQLAERKAAGLPPFSHLALLRAEARDAQAAEAFLYAARDAAQALPEAEGIAFYAAVPPVIAKVAGFERRQMLIECTSRAALQRLLGLWTPGLPALRGAHKAVVRWAVDVDPLAI